MYDYYMCTVYNLPTNKKIYRKEELSLGLIVGLERCIMWINIDFFYITILSAFKCAPYVAHHTYTFQILENNMAAKVVQKKQYDRKLKRKVDTEVDIGDLVLKADAGKQSKKGGALKPVYEGPFIVKSIKNTQVCIYVFIYLSTTFKLTGSMICYSQIQDIINMV